jgi:O-antigen/teichoic acid export membrane protein
MRRPASRSLLSNLAFLTASRVSAVAMSLVITSHLAKALGASGFGTINFSVAYVSYFAMIVSVGYEAYLTREIAHRPDRMRNLVASVITVRLALAAGSMLLVAGSLPFLNLSGIGDVVVLIQSSVLFGLAIGLTPVYQGLQRMDVTAMREVFGAFVNMVGVITFVHTPADLPAAAGIGAGAFVLTNLLLLRQYRKEFGFPRLRWLRRLDFVYAGRSMPFFWAGLMVTINLSTHLFLLGLLRSATEVGLFSAGWKLFTFSITVPTLISGLFMPRFVQVSRHPAERQRLSELFIEMIMFCVMPLVMLSIGLMPQIVLTLFGTGYLGGQHIMSLLMLNALLVSANTAFITPMLAGNRQRDVAMFGGVAAAIGVVLDLALIPPWGIEGAAVAALSTEIIGLFLYIIKRPELPLRAFASVGGRCFLAAIIATLLAHLVAATTPVTVPPLIVLLAGGLAGAAAYTAALWPMGISVIRLARGLGHMQ